MRAFKPIHPPRDFDPRLYEILATLNGAMVQLQSGIAKLDRGETTDGSSSQIGATDHGELDGLEDDDHSQYLLLAGRSGGQSVLGDSATTGTSIAPTLTLANYNLNSISGAQRITLIGGGAGSGSILVETNQFKVVERTKTTGFTLFTGSDFVNGENTGSFSFFGTSVANEPVVFISTTGNAALGDRNLVVRKRSSQTGHMLQFEDSAAGNLSHVRASDGAWVGPVVAGTTDTHPDNVFQIVGSGDATKIAMFEVDGITTATTRTITIPNLAAGTMVLSNGSLSANRVPFVSGGMLIDQSDFTFDGLVLTAPSIAFAGLTVGRLPYITTGNVLATAVTLGWDAANSRLGVGTASPQSGLHVGAQTHTGGTATDIIGEGRLMLGDQFSGVNFVNGRALDIRHSIGANIGITAVNIQPNLSAVNSASGSFIALNIQVAGAPAASSGSYSFNALRILSSGTIVASGMTCSDAIGFTLQSTPSENSAGLISNYTGGDLNVQGTGSPKALTDTGVSTNGTTTLTVTSTTNIAAGMWINPGTSTTIPAQTTVVSIDSATTLTMSNAATGTEGPVTASFQTIATDLRLLRCRFTARQTAFVNVVGFKFENPAATTAYVQNVAYIWSNALIADTAQTTNWSFIKHDITAVNATNVWALDFTSTNPNRIAGMVTIGGTAAPTEVLDVYGNINFPSGGNIITDTTNGTIIATAAAQLLGFWGGGPIAQPTVAIAAAVFVANTSGIANDTATFDGYTIGQVVKALRNAGLLA